MCANFQAKWTAFTFLAQICPKIGLGLEIQKTNVGIRISILKISCVPIFRQNEQLWLFRPKFPQKWILGTDFQKSNCRFKISTSKKPYVPIFSQNWQLWIFRPKFGEIANYMRYFGSNNVQGVAERSYVEDEMSWVEEVGTWFSNTHFFDLKKKIIFCSQHI